MDKKAITEGVIKELGLNVTVEVALPKWWWPDRTNSFTNPRLTKAGCKAFSKVIKPHEFPLEINRTGSNFKKLMRIETPFYIDFQSGTITIFSPQLVTMIMLYGSFERYLQLLNTETI